MELDALVENTLAGFDIAPQNTALCLEFLSKHSVGQLDKPRILMDELLLFLYIMGKVPISLKTGSNKRIAEISDLKFLSYRVFDFHSERPAEVKDDRFYRLFARIAKRHSRGYGPSLELLVNEIGSSPLVESRFGRPVSYDDTLSAQFLLTEYMVGKREIAVAKNGRRRRMTIHSPDDLWVLSKTAIERGVDVGLLRLLNRVLNDERRGGTSWRELVGKVGQFSQVISYFGRKVTYGDVGRPNSEHDRQLLLGYLTGQIPVVTREGSVVPRQVEDLHVFMLYDNGRLSHPDGELMRLYLRMRSRKGRSGDKDFAESFDRIGKSPQVKERYGRAITYRDVILESILHSCANVLEEIMLGKREITVDGFSIAVSAVRDLPFLRPDWSLADPEVRRLRNRIQRHTPETGIAFYDVFDRVGRRSAIVGHFGREVTRLDANPTIGRYESRRLYGSPAGQNGLLMTA